MDYNYNQYNNQYQNNDYSRELFLKMHGEKKAIRTIGSVSGICVIAYVLLQNLIAVPIGLIPFLTDLFKSSDEFFYIFTIIASVFGLLLPFLIGGNYLKKRTGAEIFYLDAPNDGVLAFLSVPMGFFICIIGNALTMYFLSWTSSTGVELTSPDYKTPETATGIILYTIAIAVIPPLVEELAVRGCIMQPLRRYGDSFAIIATSILFAILHGNLVQAPFALFAGLGFGYICCITGSLWPSIFIHLFNNLYSVAETLLYSSSVSEGKAQYIMAMSQYFFIGFGAVCTLGFVMRARKLGLKLNKSPTVIKGAAKGFSYFVNVPMIIAIVIMLYITSQFIGLLK